MATMNEKMTMREFLSTVIAAEGMSDAMVSFAKDEIAKLDAANEKRRQKNAEKMAAEKPLYDALYEALTSEPQPAADLKLVIEQSVNKTSAMLRKMRENEDLHIGVKDIKVKRDGKTSTVKGYFIEG